MSFHKFISGSLRGAFFFFLINACAINQAIDVEAFHQSIQKKIIQVEKGLAKVDQDIAFHESILSKKLDPEQQRQIQALKIQKLHILQSYVRLKEDFNTHRFQGRKKIEHKEADYRVAKKHQEDFNQRLEIIRKQFESYRQKSLTLRKYLGLKT